MERYYKVVLTRKQLERASDMLRYDGAFGANEVGPESSGLIEVRFLRCTPERWASFNVKPSMASWEAISNADWKIANTQAEGFLDGLYMAQKLLHIRLPSNATTLVEG